MPDVQLPPMRVLKSYSIGEAGQIVDYGHRLLQAASAYADTKGENAIAFVLDTGILPHKDLDANRLKQYDANFTDDTEVKHIHGTHVAGIIAAVDNQIGVIGVAPGAKLVDVQVLNASGSGSYARIAAAIRYVADLKLAPEHKDFAKIINLSLGGPSPSEMLEDAINYAIGKGVIITAAAGNTGHIDNQDRVQYPGAYQQVITVGSVGPTKEPSSYSSSGAAVDIAGPGERILSTINNNQYGRLSGTSMADPHITGVIALLASAKPALRNQSSIEAFLKEFAEDLYNTGFDIRTGAGLPVVTGYLDQQPEPEPDPEPQPDPEPEPEPEKTFTLINNIPYPVFWSASNKPDRHFTQLVYSIAVTAASYEDGKAQIMEDLKNFHMGRFFQLLPNNETPESAYWAVHFLKNYLAQAGRQVQFISVSYTGEDGSKGILQL